VRREVDHLRQLRVGGPGAPAAQLDDQDRARLERLVYQQGQALAGEVAEEGPPAPEARSDQVAHQRLPVVGVAG
jgi:hypothetical protein